MPGPIHKRPIHMTAKEFNAYTAKLAMQIRNVSQLAVKNEEMNSDILGAPTASSSPPKPGESNDV